MNDTLPADMAHSDERDYVPEVDCAALQAAQLDIGPSQPPAPPDPPQTLQQLPGELREHIEQLIAQADAEGYLRGRNELIEATQHFDSAPDGDDDDDLPAQPGLLFPRYARRSIWD